MEKTTLNGSLRATASQTHPLQTNLEFVFTDFLPNKNKQGVPATEAENLVRTGRDQPVKADFRRGKLGDHTFSMPIGHITDMETNDTRVIGRAILYKDEFPDLADHLEKASASDEGVHFSWELYYGDHYVDDAGITWLKNCVVAATTIVANPAYGGRTPLLAMAAEDNAVEELERKVASLTEQLSHSGSIDSMDPMDEIRQLLGTISQQIAALAAQVSQAELEDQQEDMQEDMGMASDNDALTTELEELRKFKSEVETQQARAAVLTTRREALKDVLAGDEFDRKADFIAGLDDDQFKTFTESLSAVATKNKQSASYSRSGIIPDPMISGDGSTSIPELAKALKGLRQ